MSQRNLDFNQLIFGRNEIPPHTKFNNILYLEEQIRNIYGIYSFQITGSTTPSSFTIDLTPETGINAEHIGYWWTSGADMYLTRKFGVELRRDSPAAYARWEDIEFKWNSGSSTWESVVSGTHLAYATSGGTNKLATLGSGTNEMNVSGITEANLTIFSMNDQSF